MQLLVESFNPSAAEGLMCRDTISVGWDGRCEGGDGGAYNAEVHGQLSCARCHHIAICQCGCGHPKRNSHLCFVKCLQAVRLRL